jgi:hypothetical protein
MFTQGHGFGSALCVLEWVELVGCGCGSFVGGIPGCEFSGGVEGEDGDDDGSPDGHVRHLDEGDVCEDDDGEGCGPDGGDDVVGANEGGRGPEFGRYFLAGVLQCEWLTNRHGRKHYEKQASVDAEAYLWDGPYGFREPGIDDEACEEEESANLENLDGAVGVECGAKQQGSGGKSGGDEAGGDVGDQFDSDVDKEGCEGQQNFHECSFVLLMNYFVTCRRVRRLRVFGNDAIVAYLCVERAAEEVLVEGLRVE